MQHIIDLPEVYRTALNDYLYYTVRYHRLNPEITNGSCATPADFGYEDIRSAFEYDMEFDYLYEYGFVDGVRNVLARTFGNILMCTYKATRWYIRLATVETPCAIYATINGYDCKVFDFRNSADRAKLDDNTINEIERYAAGPDYGEDYDEDEE